MCIRDRLPTIATGNVGSALAGGYDVANSLRFNSGSSDYLSKTYGSAGNRKTMTFSFWIKRSNLSTNQYPMSIVDASSGYQADMRFATTDVFRMYATDTAGTPRLHLLTNRVFRDVSAWYNIVVAVDTTQSTANDRVKFYVNNVQESSFATQTMGSQNADLSLNISTATHKIRQFLSQLLPYQIRPSLMGKAVAWSLIVQVGASVSVALMARGIGVNLGLGIWFSVVPLIALAIVLPISINGVGIREGGMALLLSRWGVAGEQAVAIGLLWFLTTIGTGLIGGVLFLLDKQTSRSTPTQKALRT